jgi:protein phosphatase slingshot
MTMMWSLWNAEEPRNGDGIDFITAELAVANLEAASDLQALTRHGIRAVVDASNREGNPRFPGILYHDVPIADPDERLSDFLPDVVAFIDEARRLGPVLLHCVAGISRSPALAICYLHERHGMSLLAARDHVRSRRPVADPHPLFLRVIQEYYLTQRLTPPGQLDLFPGRHRRGPGGDGLEGG